MAGLPLQGGDGTGLQQEQPLCLDGPLHVLRPTQCAFRLEGQQPQASGGGRVQAGCSCPLRVHGVPSQSGTAIRNDFDRLFPHVSLQHLEFRPGEHEAIGADLAGNQGRSQAVDGLDHHPLRVAADRIDGKEHARDVRGDQLLHHDRHCRGAMLDMVVHPVKDRPIGEQRDPTGADAVENGLSSADVEKCLSLAGKRRMGLILGRGAGSHGIGPMRALRLPRGDDGPFDGRGSRAADSRCRSRAARVCALPICSAPDRPQRRAKGPYFPARIDKLLKGRGRDAEAPRDGEPRRQQRTEISPLAAHAGHVFSLHPIERNDQRERFSHDNRRAVLQPDR